MATSSSSGEALFRLHAWSAHAVQTVRWQGQPVCQTRLLGLRWPEALPGGSVSGGPAMRKLPALPSHRHRVLAEGLGPQSSSSKIRIRCCHCFSSLGVKLSPALSAPVARGKRPSTQWSVKVPATRCAKLHSRCAML